MNYGLKNFLKNCIPDKLYLKLIYWYVMKKSLNLDNPQTFNEKLQWLKALRPSSEYSIMVDKYAVKKYVADKIGEQYIIPTIGVWDNFNEIDFSALPAQFVLKCTHDSGGLVICRDKKTLNLEEVRDRINRSLQCDYYLRGREWPYKSVKRRVIAEKYMSESNQTDLRDYKFFCFNGTPVYCQVISDRSTNETIDFFDMDWKHQPFSGLAIPKLSVQ